MRASRSPHGERGLKSTHVVLSTDIKESLPAWGAWIEIEEPETSTEEVQEGRSPHGERGLKLGYVRVRATEEQSRSPHGERGLKWQ